MLDLRTATFDGTFPFAPHYLDLEHFPMHYVDEGDGEPVVMVHGDPTWGYQYRSLIPLLSRHYRCIVPDHMGMGKSGVPQQPNPYRLQHHISNLERLLEHLEVRRVTLVLHDWGGPVGLGWAVRHPDVVKRLVLMNTWAFARWPGGPLPRLLNIIRSKRGENFVLHKHGYVQPALLGTTYYPEHLTTAILQAYNAPFPTPASRLALLCWSRDIPIHEGDHSYPDMARIEAALDRFANLPVLLVWGMQDPVLSPAVLHLWQQRYPAAETCQIADASHFLLEDAPERIAAVLGAFLRAHP